MQLRGAGAAAAPAARQRGSLGRRRVVVCAAGDKKKVVVLGGTGRVGSATAQSLLENFGDAYDVAVAGRSQENFQKVLELRPGLKGARYVACDITDLESVKVRAPRRPGPGAAGTWHRARAIGGAPAGQGPLAARRTQGAPLCRCAARRRSGAAARHTRRQPVRAATPGPRPAPPQSTIRGADLVIHTAGPFQRSKNFNVIEAAIDLKVGGGQEGGRGHSMAPL
jgi:NAD(P)-dependent dehydrogenase (short-subunit alcohol dehydrogenase family)